MVNSLNERASSATLFTCNEDTFSIEIFNDPEEEAAENRLLAWLALLINSIAVNNMRKYGALDMVIPFTFIEQIRCSYVFNSYLSLRTTRA